MSSIYFVSSNPARTSSHVCRSLCPKELNTSSVYFTYMQRDHRNRFMSLHLFRALLFLEISSIYFISPKSTPTSSHGCRFLTQISIQAQSTLLMYKKTIALNLCLCESANLYLAKKKAFCLSMCGDLNPTSRQIRIQISLVEKIQILSSWV